MTDWLRLVLSSLLFPGAAALAGSIVGGWFALRRYRSERAIDRRIDWYSRMCTTLYRMAGALETARHLEIRGQQEAGAAAREQVAALSDAFGLAAAESELYAQDRGYRATRDAVTMINSIGRHHYEIGKMFDEAASRQATFRMMADSCWQTAAVLADELREELGWQQLKRPAGSTRLRGDGRGLTNS